jgi:ribonuclease HI
MSDVIKVFTDGSSSANGKAHCKSGCGVYIENTDEKLSYTSDDAARICGITIDAHSNNVGELLGILVAMVHIKDKSVELLIHTDSMYCLNSISLWWQNWIKNNWVTASGSPVKNKEIISKILQEKGKFKNVFFKHVKGHAKEPVDKNSDEWRCWYGNDQADSLATSSVHLKEN